MSQRYLVKDTDLVEVADIIRQKSGIADPLIWPNDWKTAIQSISTTEGEIKTGFNIIRGDSIPEEILENTILVESGVEISKWIVSIDQPEEIEGCLWIQVREDGKASLDILNDDSVVLKILKTKQYYNNQWNELASYICMNGSWISLSGLSSKYQRVEYLQSSGTQYINTGYKQTRRTEYDITFEWIQQSNLSSIFGAIDYISDTSEDAGVAKYGILYREGKTQYNLGNGNFKAKYQGTHAIGEKVTASFHNGILDVNSIQTQVGTVSCLCPSPLCLFASNIRDEDGTTVYSYSSAKIYEFKISEQGKFIRHMIPCYRKSDSVIGMYDLVNDKFYTNQGTGNFIIGPEIKD